MSLQTLQLRNQLRMRQQARLKEVRRIANTFTELIAVACILAILALAASPSINNLMGGAERSKMTSELDYIRPKLTESAELINLLTENDGVWDWHPLHSGLREQVTRFDISDYEPQDQEEEPEVTLNFPQDDGIPVQKFKRESQTLDLPLVIDDFIVPDEKFFAWLEMVDTQLEDQKPSGDAPTITDQAFSEHISTEFVYLVKPKAFKENFEFRRHWGLELRDVKQNKQKGHFVQQPPIPGPIPGMSPADHLQLLQDTLKVMKEARSEMRAATNAAQYAKAQKKWWNLYRFAKGLFTVLRGLGYTSGAITGSALPGLGTIAGLVVGIIAVELILHGIDSQIQQMLSDTKSDIMALKVEDRPLVSSPTGLMAMGGTITNDGPIAILQKPLDDTGDVVAVFGVPSVAAQQSYIGRNTYALANFCFHIGKVVDGAFIPGAVRFHSTPAVGPKGYALGK